MKKSTLSNSKLGEALEWGKMMEGELEAGMRLLNAFQGLMANNPTTQTREIKIVLEKHLLLHKVEKFDLIDATEIEGFQLPLTSSFLELKKEISTRYSLVVSKQRLWLFTKRENGNFRPSKLPSSIQDSTPILEFNMISKEPLVFFVDEEEETEKKSNTRREGEEEHILVFFKQYLPPTPSSSSTSLGTLQYMAHRTLSRQLLQRDLANICRGLLLSRSRRKGYEEEEGQEEAEKEEEEEEEVWVFEEARGDRVWKLSEMEKELSEDFGDGDIFVCQWASTPDIPDAFEYFRYVVNRRLITVGPHDLGLLSASHKFQEFTVETSLLDTYQQFAKKVASHLQRDPEDIVFYIEREVEEVFVPTTRMTLVKDILRIEEERAARRRGGGEQEGEKEEVFERSRVQVAALVHEDLPEIEEEEEKEGKKDTKRALRFFTKSELSTATSSSSSYPFPLLPYVSLGGSYFLLKTFSEEGSALDLVNLLALTAKLSGIGGLLLPFGVCFEKPFTLLLELPPERFIPLKTLLSISSPLASVLSSWLHRIQIARGIAFVLRRLHSSDSPVAHGDLSSLVVFVDLLRIGAVIHYVPLPTTRCVLISNLNFKWKQGSEATSSPSSSPASPSGIEEDIIALGHILLELLEITTGEEEKVEELTLEVANQWRNLVTVCVHTPSAITAEDIQKELEDIYISINK